MVNTFSILNDKCIHCIFYNNVNQIQITYNLYTKWYISNWKYNLETEIQYVYIACSELKYRL